MLSSRRERPKLSISAFRNFLMDWKETLAALGASGTLPEGDDNYVEEPASPNEPASQLKILLDRKGRKGKSATIIEGFNESDEEVAELARMLRQAIGTGGSSRGGEILLQGDRREQAASLLRQKGYKVKVV